MSAIPYELSKLAAMIDDDEPVTPVYPYVPVQQQHPPPQDNQHHDP
jgi:hypothetical protein